MRERPSDLFWCQRENAIRGSHGEFVHCLTITPKLAIMPAGSIYESITGFIWIFVKLLPIVVSGVIWDNWHFQHPMESCSVQLCCYAIYQIDENDYSFVLQIDYMNSNPPPYQNRHCSFKQNVKFLLDLMAHLYCRRWTRVRTWIPVLHRNRE